MGTARRKGYQKLGEVKIGPPQLAGTRYRAMQLLPRASSGATDLLPKVRRYASRRLALLDLPPVHTHMPAVADDLTTEQRFARWSLGASRIDPAFPARPEAYQIEAEYTPERVTRLAMYIAGKRNTEGNSEQYEEDVSECIALIYDRINKYKRGLATIHPNYPFYYWLLFDVRTALRDLRDRGRGMFVHFSTLQEDGKPEFPGRTDNPADTQIDVRSAIAKLPARQREALLLYYEQHLNQPDIAIAMKISQPGVHHLLTRAKSNLAKILADPDEPLPQAGAPKHVQQVHKPHKPRGTAS